MTVSSFFDAPNASSSVPTPGFTTYALASRGDVPESTGSERIDAYGLGNPTSVIPSEMAPREISVHGELRMVVTRLSAAALRTIAARRAVEPLDLLEIGVVRQAHHAFVGHLAYTDYRLTGKLSPEPCKRGGAALVESRDVVYDGPAVSVAS